MTRNKLEMRAFHVSVHGITSDGPNTKLLSWRRVKESILKPNAAQTLAHSSADGTF